MDIKKLAISAGHYYYTSGRRCLKKYDPNETREWVLNDRVADKIEKLLSGYEGIEILRTDDTTGETLIDIEERVSAANNWGADFYLSLHHNGGINGGSGGGIVAYRYRYSGDEAKEWQRELYDALIEKTGLKGNRASPLVASGLYECKYTDMPSVLLELGFMDSRTDIPIILTEKYADNCAKAIVEVIVKRWKLKANNTVDNEKQDVDNEKPESIQPDDIGTKSGIVVELDELKSGDEGNQVKCVQRTLYSLGYDLGASLVDGVFGDKTDSAIRKYQKRYGLKVDGVVGQETWNKILKG